MTAQRLDRVLTACRIGDPNGAYPTFDTMGSKLNPGRWNTAASPIIYALQQLYSTAMLEKLAHGSGRLPTNQHFVEITIPNGIDYEMVDPAYLPCWGAPACVEAKAFGETWQRGKRFADRAQCRCADGANFLLNPEHPVFPQVTCGLHRPVWWDARLFPTGL